MNDTNVSGEEPGKAKGRGLCILIAIRPSISRKEISEIRRKVVSALSDSYSTVEISYYPRDASSTYLKILAEQATFRLDINQVKIWYSQLLERSLRRLRQDLLDKGHSILEIRVELLSRTLPREQESEYVPMLSREELTALLPAFENIQESPSNPPPTPSNPGDAVSPPLPPPPSPQPEIKGEKDSSLPWIERDLQNPDELSCRQKVLQEYREGRLEVGIRLCLKGLERYADSPYLLYLLGIMVSSQGKDADARGIFDHLLSIRPDCVPAYVARGHLRRRLQDESGAAEDFAKAREREPDLLLDD